MTVLQFETIQKTQTAYEWLSRLDAVRWVEPDLFLPESIMTECFEPMALYTGPSTWNVDRVGTADYAEFLRSNCKTDQIVVAVLDSGVDVNHPIFHFEDERGNVGTRIYRSWCIIYRGEDVTDTSHIGHGTVVAGIVVANTPNLNNVKIMPIRLSRNGTTIILMLEGTIEAVNRGAHVINASFAPFRGERYPSTMIAAQNHAHANGVVWVGGSGNFGYDLDPVRLNAHPDTIRVAATDRGDTIWVGSNYSSSETLVHISAPGLRIASSMPGGGYMSWDGTSFATPHVSAAVAMYFLANYDENLTPLQVRDAIMTYINEPAGWQHRFGTGILDMRKAISEVVPSVNFNFYGIDTVETISVPINFDQPLDMTAVNLAMDELEHYDDAEMHRFAHWGWFTDEALNASGRYSTESNVAAGLRRPAVGTTGFDVNQVITQEVLDRYARGGVIHLHSVWSLWGDVNDDDRVNSDDLRELTWHVGQLEPRPIMNLAAADVHHNGIVNSDDLRNLTWYVGQLSPRPVLGASPTTNLANTFIDDSGRLTDNEAIWHISHEVITPEAEYVDIRIYLYQNPTNSTNPHGGMDVSFIRFGYDSDVLSNPRQTPAMNFFDFSLLTEVERIDFNAMIAAFTGFPFFMTYEAARDAAKGQSMFSHAWVRPIVANHEGFRFTMHYSYEYFGSGGHGLGSHILQLNWSPEAGHNPKGHPFVYVRFDVTADLPVGTVTPLTFLAEQDMAGDIEVVTNAGSVTIVAE